MAVARRHGRKTDSGAALIMVLWLVAALSLVVLAGAQGVRQQAQRATLDMERLRAESVLDAAIQLTAQKLLSDKGKDSQYRIQRLGLGSNDVWVETTPSGGLVDVNVASDALLQALFQRTGGLSPGEATILAARVRDYLDPDDTPSGVGGAEAAQYRAAGWPSLPRNSALDDTSELKSVLGMTPTLYEIIAPHLGINGQQRIEIDSAPPALIDALTGQPGLGARIRNSPPETRAGALLSGAAAEFFSPARSSGAQTMRFKAFVRAESDRWWVREAWIDLSERPDALTPWTTLSIEPTRRFRKPEQEFKP
ncbi:general secretion pathway protein GspK [Acidovorax sp. sic0104]|uniref:general secretion pathway protein GspK n=1 Tax=Acidovorax sp. sic0104 TaxID=2854784 RepID=UPI001C455B85|nr:type II secretion system protein GspK [Acidovorax sp. sic0104]MBV7540254.1 general secretion pathway protein GspK [Acidovorax sp. sic0104]